MNALLRILSTRIVRFLLVGGSGALGYVALSYLFFVLGLSQWVASSTAYLCLIPVVFLLQKHFVFQSNASGGRSFFRYVAIQAVSVLISAVIPALTARVGLHPLASYLLVAVSAASVSYLLQLRWAFAADQGVRS